MGSPNASYSVTMRVMFAGAERPTMGRVLAAISDTGGAIVALDTVEAHGDQQTVDITFNASGQSSADAITAAVENVDGVTVHRVSDRTFLLHLHGKLEVHPSVPLRTRDDLSMAYTPGVARVCRAIMEDPEDARRLTVKGNTVAIVTDGSAVLGLGDIGPEASLPVMEGKAALFKRFAGIDAWPVCLDVTDPDAIVATVEAIAPTYGGINLEDISAPKCFEIERRLRESLNIPVFHDDQHGTAIVTLAALYNALRLVGKQMEDITVTVAGAGAAGVAVIQLLQRSGVGDVIVTDREGIIATSRSNLTETKRELAESTNVTNRKGDLAHALEGSDVFIGVSGPGLLEPHQLSPMADDAIVFAMANPDPEVDPVGAKEYAAVVATGRSDYPNQINNVLAFPGVFRGALDARARYITEDMKMAAARALADVVQPDELQPTYIMPSVFNEAVAPAVAGAVREVAERDS